MTSCLPRILSHKCSNQVTGTLRVVAHTAPRALLQAEFWHHTQNRQNLPPNTNLSADISFKRPGAEACAPLHLRFYMHRRMLPGWVSN